MDQEVTVYDSSRLDDEDDSGSLIAHIAWLRVKLAMIPRRYRKHAQIEHGCGQEGWDGKTRIYYTIPESKREIAKREREVAKSKAKQRAALVARAERELARRKAQRFDEYRDLLAEFGVDTDELQSAIQARVEQDFLPLGSVKMNDDDTVEVTLEEGVSHADA